LRRSLAHQGLPKKTNTNPAPPSDFSGLCPLNLKFSRIYAPDSTTAVKKKPVLKQTLTENNF
jgi:hypothetical protein